MSRTYRSKKNYGTHSRKAKTSAESPKIWVGDEKVIQKHFKHVTRLLEDERRIETEQYKKDVLSLNPEARAKRGKALLFMRIADLRYNPSGQRLVTFAYKDGRDLDGKHMTLGTLVGITGVKNPNAEPPIGTVYERSRTKISVAFYRELPEWTRFENTYHLTLADNQTTYDRMFSALKTVCEAKNDRVARLRDIALGLKAAETKDGVKLSDFKWFNPKLNDLQQESILKIFQTEDVFILHGPPGTGKTSVLVEAMRQMKARGETVLVSAPSNAACDHIVETLAALKVPVTRMGHPARASEIAKRYTLSHQLAGHPYAKVMEKNFAQIDQLFKKLERHKDRREFTREEKSEIFKEIDALKAENKELKRQIFNEVWNVSDIVVATHTGCGDKLLETKNFDWVIIDEATQGLEPSTWLPILHAGRVVMAGDHEQLPPTILGRAGARSSLSYTLFERFHDVLPEECRLKLTTQYRMHENIMGFSSRVFYEGELQADAQNQKHVLSGLDGLSELSELNDKPLQFIDTAGYGCEERIDGMTRSRFNGGEVQLLMQQLEGLVRSGVPAKKIAIISPYRAQIDLIQAKLAESDLANQEKIEVDTIDSFQGREKEVVILSLVRSNLNGELGFLKDVRRMNVAMTRAKRKLIIIGDSATLSGLPFYQDFIDYAESIESYHSVWEFE